MSDIVVFQNDCQVHLLGKKTLNGVTILAVDRQDIVNEVQQAIAELGTAVIIGVPRGRNEAPNSPGLQEMLTVSAVVMENVVLNRNRTLFGTVADEAARLALAGTVPQGQVVAQSDVGSGLYYLAFEGETSEQMDLSFDASDVQLQRALNDMDSVANQGRVTVSGTVASGYTITWNSAGPRTLFKAIKTLEFDPGAVLQVVETQVGTNTLPSIQTLLIRQWWWLIGGSGAAPSNWGLFFTATEILQLVMRSLHSFAPSPTQKVVSTGFSFGNRTDVVDIAATFEIRFYLDQSEVR